MSPSEDEKMETLLTMSGKEVSRLEVMQRLKEKSLSQKEAAEMVGVSVRQVKRMFKAYRDQGAAGLVSQRRRAYFERYGKPVAFYSDKHGIFRVSPTSVFGDNLTQFGRAMQALDIQIICANTPQAKGRVERANQTLQDRLVKEMHLLGTSNLEAGNAYLPEFIADFNRRFGVQPTSQHNAHRPLTAQDNLARILTWQEPRTLSKNLTLQFEKVVYQVQTERPTYAMRNAQVTVCKDASANITLLYKDKPLPYTIFHKQAKQAEVVETKDLDAALQNQPSAHPPAHNHPWRRSFAIP